MSGSPSSARPPFARSARASRSRAVATPASAACCARRMPGELVLALPAAAVVEQLLVDRELDPLRAQHVREAEREGARDRRALDLEPFDDVDDLSRRCLVQAEAAPADLVRAELLGRAHLEPGAERLDAHCLHGSDRDDPPAVLLRVDEVVGNPERHLVAELRRPLGVADDKDVATRAILSGDSYRTRPSVRRLESAPVDADLRTLRERLAEISDLTARCSSSAGTSV